MKTLIKKRIGNESDQTQKERERVTIMRIYGIVVWPRLPHSKPKPHVQDVLPNHVLNLFLLHTLFLMA